MLRLNYYDFEDSCFVPFHLSQDDEHLFVNADLKIPLSWHRAKVILMVGGLSFHQEFFNHREGKADGKTVRVGFTLRDKDKRIDLDKVNTITLLAFDPNRVLPYYGHRESFFYPFIKMQDGNWIQSPDNVTALARMYDDGMRLIGREYDFTEELMSMQKDLRYQVIQGMVLQTVSSPDYKQCTLIKRFIKDQLPLLRPQACLDEVLIREADGYFHFKATWMHPEDRLYVNGQLESLFKYIHASRIWFDDNDAIVAETSDIHTANILYCFYQMLSKDNEFHHFCEQCGTQVEGPHSLTMSPWQSLICQSCDYKNDAGEED